MKNKIEAIIQLSNILIEVVANSKNSPMGGIPSGALYAYIMDKVSLDVYNLALAMAVKTGKISINNHFLTYNG
jgi:hypothetical protein